nr:hypothetical protein CFP56_61662 [Quercus suber]
MVKSKGRSRSVLYHQFTIVKFFAIRKPGNRLVLCFDAKIPRLIRLYHLQIERPNSSPLTKFLSSPNSFFTPSLTPSPKRLNSFLDSSLRGDPLLLKDQSLPHYLSTKEAKAENKEKKSITQ